MGRQEQMTPLLQGEDVYRRARDLLDEIPGVDLVKVNGQTWSLINLKRLLKRF